MSQAFAWGMQVWGTSSALWSLDDWLQEVRGDTAPETWTGGTGSCPKNLKIMYCYWFYISEVVCFVTS